MDESRNIDFKARVKDETGKGIESVEKRLRELNKNLGKGGFLGGAIQSGTELLKLDIGEKLAQGFERGSEKLLELKQMAREGKADWKDYTTAITYGVPYVGALWKTGVNLREVFTGEKAELEEVNKELEKQVGFQERLAAIGMKRIADEKAGWTEHLKAVNDIKAVNATPAEREALGLANDKIDIKAKYETDLKAAKVKNPELGPAGTAVRDALDKYHAQRDKVLSDKAAGTVFQSDLDEMHRLYGLYTDAFNHRRKLEVEEEQREKMAVGKVERVRIDSLDKVKTETLKNQIDQKKAEDETIKGLKERRRTELGGVEKSLKRAEDEDYDIRQKDASDLYDRFIVGYDAKRRLAGEIKIAEKMAHPDINEGPLQFATAHRVTREYTGKVEGMMAWDHPVPKQQLDAQKRLVELLQKWDPLVTAIANGQQGQVTSILDGL